MWNDGIGFQIQVVNGEMSGLASRLDNVKSRISSLETQNAGYGTLVTRVRNLEDEVYGTLGTSSHSRIDTAEFNITVLDGLVYTACSYANAPC